MSATCGPFSVHCNIIFCALKKVCRHSKNFFPPILCQNFQGVISERLVRNLCPAVAMWLLHNVVFTPIESASI